MELSLEDLRRAWALLPVVKVKQMCRDGGVLALEHPKDLGFFCMEYTYTERARPSEEAVGVVGWGGSRGAKKERNILQPTGSTLPSTSQSGWELLGLQTHPDYPALEYVCSFVKKMHKAQRPEITNQPVVPFALFPKGQSLAFLWR